MKTPHWRSLGLAMTLCAIAVTAQARHHRAHTREGDSAPGQFDYYLVSLSWAPTYCLTHSDDGAECSGKGYGFVLHGLWPQYDSGGYPERCGTEDALSAEAVAKGRTVYPSERLMRHEWQEHGTCSGLDALGYFQAADRATASIRIPAELEAPHADQRLDADQIIALFRDANPGLPDRSVVVACSRDALSEVRVCLNRDLTVRSCGRGVRISCPRVPLSVPASR